MYRIMKKLLACSALPLALFALNAQADENLLGYVKGAETLPEGAAEFYQFFTQRQGKSYGDYWALDTNTEFEYGVTNSFNVSGALHGMALDTSDLVIDGYLPGDKKFGWKLTGVETAIKYNFLSPALDDFGLSTYISGEYSWVDKHSGQRKDTISIDANLLMQKYFMEGQLVWAGNIGMETTWAKRAHIDNLPEGFDWPTTAEMEIELKAGTGLTYRFAPDWYLGAEALYEEEHETEVNLERWSWFAGPSLHYGGQQWWATLTYMQQIRGGGEKFPEQTDRDLHLIEKTETEWRLKIGYNF
ncbi:hypothetical protein PVT67_12845 [Gallaecimonas kandeliae]|uniref:DUF6662 family protein n=1 Tax=Gallaecimonas kandeliae TaxID=3029055 RepID=UPI0026476DFA|nr:DUF6662 family protein [Gallaecimonas kandeliae]WKE64551.1 hypothetical protein PVT67_12845 [Gallaecimonas kandeliae]